MSKLTKVSFTRREARLTKEEEFDRILAEILVDLAVEAMPRGDHRRNSGHLKTETGFAIYFETAGMKAARLPTHREEHFLVRLTIRRHGKIVLQARSLVTERGGTLQEVSFKKGPWIDIFVRWASGDSTSRSARKSRRHPRGPKAPGKRKGKGDA